jgi:predicted  nucleic acid-binding Zn-ribbon protein
MKHLNKKDRLFIAIATSRLDAIRKRMEVEEKKMGMGAESSPVYNAVNAAIGSLIEAIEQDTALINLPFSKASDIDLKTLDL